MGDNEERAAAEMLEQFVCLFQGRGWLNRFVSLRSGDGRYRIFCSQSSFLAYRTNDNWGTPPGVPGWPVCMVTREHIFCDGHMCAFPTREPESLEWLRRLTDDDFEVT